MDSTYDNKSKGRILSICFSNSTAEGTTPRELLPSACDLNEPMA